MSKLYLFLLALLVMSCARYQNTTKTNTDGEIHLNGNFILQNPKITNLIDSFISFRVEYEKRNDLERTRVTPENFYLFFIYQSDAFVHIKISYMEPTKYLLSIIPLGSGYFVYKGNVFLVYTGLERICNSKSFIYTGYDTIPKKDSSLLKEIETKFGDKIINKYVLDVVTNKMEPVIGILAPVTFDAALVYDTIIIRRGQMSPFKSPEIPNPTGLLKRIRKQLEYDPSEGYEKAVIIDSLPN